MYYILYNTKTYSIFDNIKYVFKLPNLKIHISEYVYKSCNKKCILY